MKWQSAPRLRRVLYIGVPIIVTTVCVAATEWLHTAVPTMPSFAAVRAAYHPSDVQLLDRHGEVIHELRIDDSARRLRWTALGDVSPALRAALITSEDRRFDRHGGVDGWALLAAAAERFTGGRRGGSTISMQLATLLDHRLQRGGQPRTLRRKWEQIRAAWVLERSWSKNEILEAYLNLVTFRGELQGVSAAANLLFSKVPHGITEAEALVLAALVRSPNAPAAAIARRAAALRTVNAPATSAAQLAQAVTNAARVAPGNGPRVALAAQIARRLLNRETGAVGVRSTLDASVQRLAAEALQRHLLALRGRRVGDGAVVVVDNASGDVLAYVGGSGALSRAPYVDAARAHRQAGSVLKPFLYGMAIDERLLTAASLLDDAPFELPVTGGLYRPRNYDDQFRGLVSLRTALAASLNIPAVRTLGLVGGDTFVRQLRRLGFARVVESGDYYGPALALGSADVSLWELVNAYRTLANGGTWKPLRVQPLPPQPSGERVATAANQAETARLYSPAAAFIVADILADRESRSGTFGLESPLGTRFWSAVKTGTSKSMRDNWCIGFSRTYTVGVWVGNLSGEPMRDVSGVSGAAPIWLEMMNELHRDLPSAAPAAGDGVRAEHVEFPTALEPGRREWFLTGTEPAAGGITLARQRPRIVAPVNDTVIAIDPDIPPDMQRVVLAAHPFELPVRWLLDGTEIATGTTALWMPSGGRHTLTLIDAVGRVQDSVGFVVRGSGRRN